ncbi:MAG: NAD-dependent epimerase/dehydratase family protein [Phenylobacterium sp.]|uniref:NAD-dependent epimerase/dehydratase family protein n=1 Tax=Phenylobacterium sp. TaxID=1871053 RepID=UPI002733B134|nr:NAD-dependent epimerase/dehydratase family protein [Phenylobacterium sp.]MDP3174661.1 NAD-dependent epimerase/dehydratase family protein [Phenylobacterium sp.]
MRVFLTGATGYTGGVVLEHLLAAGLEVSALARPHHLPTLPVRPGLSWIGGDFAQPEIIFDAARATDATIHIGASHDVENAEMERLDGLTIRAVADALAGSGKTFINTSATPVYGDTGPTPRDESEPVLHPLPAREWRLRHDRETVAMSGRGLRSVVLRPPMIYGRGAGVLGKQIARAQASGKARYIGAGTPLSSTVDVDVLAVLYLKALRNERAQGVYNAASDEVVRAADIAQAIAQIFGPGIVAESWPLDDARKTMGILADISTIDCVVSSERARRELGWAPNAISMMGDLAAGSYRALAAR